jgi:hypothetical protein
VEQGTLARFYQVVVKVRSDASVVVVFSGFRRIRPVFDKHEKVFCYFAEFWPGRHF